MKKTILSYDEFLNESLNAPKLDNNVIENYILEQTKKN